MVGVRAVVLALARGREAGAVGVILLVGIEGTVSADCAEVVRPGGDGGAGIA